jgi:hypothetical protein
MNPELDPIIESQFTYHAPFGSQTERFVTIRDKAKELAYVIKTACPPCADTTAAIRHLREAVMTANAAIACNEIPPPNRTV